MDCNEYFKELAINHLTENPPSGCKDASFCKLPELFNVTFLDEILDRELPPEKWIVDGFIPETGLHLLTGTEKIGMSWFALQCAQGIALGGSVLGKISVKKSKVLYMSLEERWQLLLQRIKPLGFSKTENNIMVIEDIDQDKFADVASTLEFMLELDPSIRFIIINTVDLFFGVEDLNDYRMAIYCLESLKFIADKKQVSILMVHHANKSGHYESKDFIKRSLGSTVFSAICDTIIYLAEPRNERKATVFVMGREEMEKEYTLRIDENCGWVLQGDKREVIEGETQKLIADWIKKHGEAAPIDIYNGLESEGYTGTRDTIRQTCHRMKIAGKVTNDNGTYALYTPPVTPVTVSQLELENKERSI